MNPHPILKELREAGIVRASIEEPMSKHTSWRIGGPADYLCVVENGPQLEAAVSVARVHNIPCLVLGGGNNILVSDAGIDGLVILNRLRGIAIEQHDSVHRLHCGAGVFFARAAHFSAHHGFTGMEWGIAIPGTVGGGVVNNAGAHASDVARSLISANVVDVYGHHEVLNAADLAYRYRQSALKTEHTTQTRMIVTACSFRVEPDVSGSAPARLEELREHRLHTQPVKEPSAGSTFKNPEGNHAGALVDRAGLKGHRLGGAQISQLHANFILNTGGALAADVLELIRLAQARVFEQSGIWLQPEVQFVGRWPLEVLRSVLCEAA